MRVIDEVSTWPPKPNEGESFEAYRERFMAATEAEILRPWAPDTFDPLAKVVMPAGRRTDKNWFFYWLGGGR